MKIWTQQEEADHLNQRFTASKTAKSSFAKLHGIKGGAAMIYQHTRGLRPLNLEAAMAYARGFGVPLEEISPRLALIAAESNTVMSPEGAAAAKEINEVRSTYPLQVQQVIEMMMNTDEEGRDRIKLGVSDTLFQYNKLKQERIQALGLLPADLVEELRQATDPKIVELIRGTLLMLDVHQAQRMAK